MMFKKSYTFILNFNKKISFKNCFNTFHLYVFNIF